MLRQNITKLKIIIIIIAVVSVMILLTQINQPQFFDIFGVICFSFLLILGIWMLKTKKEVPHWAEFLVFLIALLGLIVDLTIVIKNYFLK